MLSGVSLLAVSNVNNPVGLTGLPYVMWSVHFFVTHIQTENISSWNGPTFHVCCFMLERASTKTFVSRVQKTAKKSSLTEKFVSRVTRQPRYHCIYIYIFIYLFIIITPCSITLRNTTCQVCSYSCLYGQFCGAFLFLVV